MSTMERRSAYPSAGVVERLRLVVAVHADAPDEAKVIGAVGPETGHSYVELTHGDLRELLRRLGG